MARHAATVCFSSPLGMIEVESSHLGVTRVRLSARGRSREVGDGAALESARLVRDEILSYLAGERRSFSVPIVLEGTPFQRAVWVELQRVPYGETRTYGEVAAAVGRPRAARAVGAACGANPLPIVIPCHRIVGGGGSLVGFGGGVEMKQRLLTLEQASNA
jgi:methylated-DNA-[protein]-cysteine S-methyltransferase